jgi:hypothetical protein
MRNYKSNTTTFNTLFSFYFTMYITQIKAWRTSKLQAFGIPSPFIMMANIASTAVDVIVAFILALIASLIGVNLIGPVATAVGGALKNGNLTGAANSLTAQITLIFVTVIILGIVVFLALFGKLAGHQAE